MASSDLVGVIVCPLCGNDHAQVLEQTKGSKAGRLYYRCYQDGGSLVMRCGTIQCVGPTGQLFIKKNMRPLVDPAASDAGRDRPIVQNEPESVSDRPLVDAPEVPKKRVGILSSLAASIGGDD